jgi:predicted SAM-dependent methyltransferase
MMCGQRNFGPTWMHVDGSVLSHIDDNDIYLGRIRPDSVSLLYCSHGIAYFDRQEIVPLLQAWFRVLKPGGVLRLSTTDARLIAYLLADVVREHGVSPSGSSLEIMSLNDHVTKLSDVVGPLYGKMDLNGSKIYHKTMYDFADLSDILQSVGFANVELYDHRKTEHPNTGDRSDFFDDHSAAYINGMLISLNVQCIKPATA